MLENFKNGKLSKTWSILYTTQDQLFLQLFACVSLQIAFLKRLKTRPIQLVCNLHSPHLFSSLSLYSESLSFCGDMGRAPCCDKANVKRGPWSPEEDETLRNYIEKHGSGGNWIALPKKAGT